MGISCNSVSNINTQLAIKNNKLIGIAIIYKNTQAYN